MIPAWVKLPHGGGFQSPDTIVIHAMAEYIVADDASARKYGAPAGVYHALRWLDLCKLSAHALICPNGAIIRTRQDDQMAWHARGHNRDTLGIEYLVPGKHDYGTFLAAMKGDYLPPPAYTAGLDMIREWIDAYSIESITTHEKLDPDRKHDPGAGFPLDQLLDDIGV